jgi:hypothetical protein
MQKKNEKKNRIFVKQRKRTSCLANSCWQRRRCCRRLCCRYKYILFTNNNTLVRTKTKIVVNNCCFTCSNWQIFERRTVEFLRNETFAKVRRDTRHQRFTVNQSKRKKNCVSKIFRDPFFRSSASQLYK